MLAFPGLGLTTGNTAVLLSLLAFALSGMPCDAADQWTRIGPEGGIVNRLAADPLNPSTIYAVTGGGVFKTADAGASWTAVNGLPALDERTIQAVAVDPQNAGTVYAAGCGGIFKSTDGGANWNAIGAGLTLSYCVSWLAIAPSNSNIVYASDGAEIHQSPDGGATWTQASPWGAGPLIAVDPQNPDTLYTNISNVFSKSTDGGVTWNPANSGLPGAHVLALDPQRPGTLYAGGQGQGQTVPIFKSTDGGVSWSPASRGLPSPPAPNSGYDLVLSIAVSPQTAAAIYALIIHTAGSTYEFLLASSTDGAASWSTAAVPALNGILNGINAGDLFNPGLALTPDPQAPGTLYLGIPGGVLKTTEGGGHWSFANSGLRALPVGAFLVDPASGALLVGKTYDTPTPPGPALFRSTDRGASWVPAGAGLPAEVDLLVADPQNPGRLYLLGDPGASLFQSGDGGANWAEISTKNAGFWMIGPLDYWDTPFAIDPQNSSIMYSAFICTTCRNLSKSIDGGHTWTELQSSLLTESQYPGQGGCCPGLSAVAVDPRSPDTVYAGTAGDGYGLGGSLWKSQDGGANWLNLTSGDFHSIILDPTKPGTIYFTSPFSKSTDGGQTWSKSQNRFCGLLLLDPQNSGTLYCAGTDGVFISRDAGARWRGVGSGLAGSVNALVLDSQGPATLYAATSAGLFAITLAPAVARPRDR